ncbi:MAG: hypothetical protein ACR2K6_01435 [Solirubrobacterales bacterium]
MSTPGPRERISEAAERLDRIAEQLRSPETDDATAVALAQEAAELASEVGSLAAEAARAAFSQERG